MSIFPLCTKVIIDKISKRVIPNKIWHYPLKFDENCREMYVKRSVC